MAQNNSNSNNNQALQILRGTRAGIIENKSVKLLPGQPIYNETDNYLTVGSLSGDKTIDAMPIAVRELKGYFADNLSSSGKLAETLDGSSPRFWIKGLNIGYGKVIGAVVREDVGAVDVTFAYISVGVWAKILQQFDRKYGGSFYQWVTFFDQVSAKETTRKMYVGDRTTAGMHLLDKNGKPQAWLGAKLQLVEK